MKKLKENRNKIFAKNKKELTEILGMNNRGRGLEKFDF